MLRCGLARVTIDLLPDVALLEIFDFYMDELWMYAWYTLVQVCRKWRRVVFGSPRRLDLRLHCSASTPVRETLSVWPLLPIVIWGDGHEVWGVDNIIAALEHSDRISQLDLTDISSLQLEKVLATMHQPFPTLTQLQLWPRGETVSVVPTSFLGGNAPCLKSLNLDGIPFPGLPGLLVSATHLVDLYYRNIPHSGYISPEAMVTCLSALTNLEILEIGFGTPRWLPDRQSQSPPPPPHVLLPALTELRYKGVSDYLEDILARIDAPLLNKLGITLFNELIFDTPQLTHFINHTPKFVAHDEARVFFSDRGVWITIPQSFDGRVHLEISCRQSDWQLSALAQICSSPFPWAVISTVERLFIESGSWQPHWQEDIESSQWLELLHPFSAVKDIFLSSELTPHIAPALQDVVEGRATGVLPALQTLFLEEPPPSGPLQETTGELVPAQLDSSRCIAISSWERE
jgi:F-box-like